MFNLIGVIPAGIRNYSQLFNSRTRACASLLPHRMTASVPSSKHLAQLLRRVYQRGDVCLCFDDCARLFSALFRKT